MKTRERIQRKFEELEAELVDVVATINTEQRVTNYGSPSWVRPAHTIPFETVDSSKWQGWCTSALHLLKLVFGESGIHFKQFDKILNQARSLSNKAEALGGILAAAKKDFEGGFAVSFEASIAGEIFADFVGLAEHAIGEKQKDVAAVLACAALEDALKRIGAANGLDVAEKEMSDVVNALIGARVIEGAAAKMLRTMPKIRNHAFHAEWGHISEPEVGGVAGFVRQLLLSHLSGS
jgi:hypothetical protein